MPNIFVILYFDSPQYPIKETFGEKERFYLCILVNILQQHKYQIDDLCKKHKVKNLYAFGSVLTEKFGKESDVDLMVTFESVALKHYADNYFDFKFALENMLLKPIDLLETQAIKNPYFLQNINLQKQLIYGH